jgi:hypothetical protein
MPEEMELPTLVREIDKLVELFITEHPERDYHFNVNPRYTAGSPAKVNYETAKRVACSELLAHARGILGVSGEEEQTKARRGGLRGIVECYRENGRGWSVLDMLTGDTSLRDPTS